MPQSRTFGESKGLILRKIANIVWFFFPVLIVCITVLCFYLIFYNTVDKLKPLEIVSDNCTITDYYKYTDETVCEIEVTFNQPVYAGSITVAFYDEDGRQTETQELPFFGTTTSAITHTTLRSQYVFVEGRIDSYQILDYSDIKSIERSNYYNTITKATKTCFWLLLIWIVLRSFYVIPLALTSLFFSCKTYRVGEHVIVVYAGRMKHYIKVDGRKYDEKNALISFSAIKLNATLETGEQIEVYIPSFTKRLSLRVNGVLAEPSSI